MTRIAVIGSRNFVSYNRLAQVLYDVIERHPEPHIVSGGAVGTDSLAQKYAEKMGLSITIHYPDWNRHGKAAGMIRNRKIIEDCDIAVAFWVDESKGTAGAIELCRKLGKPVEIVRIDGR